MKFEPHQQLEIQPKRSTRYYKKPLPDDKDEWLAKKVCLATGNLIAIDPRKLPSLGSVSDPNNVFMLCRQRIQCYIVAAHISHDNDAICMITQINAVVADVVQRFGRIDILINNAGLGFNHDAVDVSEADWDEIMNVNLKGLFFMCQAVGKQMLAQNYGRIINMSSQAGRVGILRHAVYCASKGGVNQLIRVLALEWSPHNITVNAVAPTFIRTPGTAERLDTPDFAADVLSRLPIGHVGNTMDVAGAVIYLASAAAALVTGTILLVDGGWTAQ